MAAKAYAKLGIKVGFEEMRRHLSKKHRIYELAKRKEKNFI